MRDEARFFPRKVLGGMLFLSALCGGMISSYAQEDTGVVVRKDISYLKQESSDPYALEQCKLDVYLPADRADACPLIVWFHGGALEGGSKTSSLTVKMAGSLAARGVGVIVPEYRLSPKVKFPEYVKDAAEAVRWAVENAGELNAKPEVFVGGHSAGGYLAALLAMDARYLNDAGVDIGRIAGFVPMSGQMTTHSTVAKENGKSDKVITADDAAPIHFLRKDTPPILVIVGDNDWPARLEENQYFVSALRKMAENENVSLAVIKDRTHGSILKKAAEADDPAAAAILDFMNKGGSPGTFKTENINN